MPVLKVPLPIIYPFCPAALSPHGPRDLTHDKLAAIRNAVIQDLWPYSTDHGISFSAEVLIVSGRKSEDSLFPQRLDDLPVFKHGLPPVEAGLASESAVQSNAE